MYSLKYNYMVILLVSKYIQITTVLLSIILISSAVSFEDAFADSNIYPCDNNNERYLDFAGLRLVQSITATDPDNPKRITITFKENISNPEEIVNVGFKITKSNVEKKIISVSMGNAPNEIYVDVNVKVHDSQSAKKIVLTHRNNYESLILFCEDDEYAKNFHAETKDSGIFKVKYQDEAEHPTDYIFFCMPQDEILCDPDYPPQLTIQTKSHVRIDVLTIALSSLPNVTIQLGVNVMDDKDSKSSLREKINWYSDIQGFLETGRGPTINTLDLTVGVHTITANVTDSGGNYAEDTITIDIKNVIDNPPSVYEIHPKYENIIIIKDELTKSDTLGLIVHDDLDMSKSIKLKTVWRSSIDGVLIEGATKLGLLRMDLTPGAHTITAQSYDWGGHLVTHYIHLTIVD